MDFVHGEEGVQSIRRDTVGQVEVLPREDCQSDSLSVIKLTLALITGKSGRETGGLAAELGWASLPTIELVLLSVRVELDMARTLLSTLK